MVLRFFLFAVVFLFISCADTEFNNPYDPESPDYIGNRLSSSLSVEHSSNSADISSSSVVVTSSSSVAKSSSSVKLSSSSSKLGSSSSGIYCLDYEWQDCTLLSNGDICPDWTTSSNSCPGGWYIVGKSSSSAVVSSSSSIPSSSSSVPPSSSSVVKSSSSAVAYSSNSKPSSSSAVPGSSSASTQSGVVYGTPVSYEGEIYQTVVIGTQTWFKRNLNYDVGKTCDEDDRGNICDVYLNDALGRVYNWSTAMALPSSCNSSTCSEQIKAKHQGICPSGWHIPSDNEWTTLTNFVGSSTAGTKLKANSSLWSTNTGTDTYGFAALPGGINFDGSNVSNYGNWWSTTEVNANSAYSRGMSYDDESVRIGIADYSKPNMFSVRCLKD